MSPVRIFFYKCLIDKLLMATGDTFFGNYYSRKKLHGRKMKLSQIGTDIRMPLFRVIEA